MTSDSTSHPRPFHRFVGGALAVLGLATVAGGMWLVALGGSFFYAACGLLLACTGLLLLARRTAAAH